MRISSFLLVLDTYVGQLHDALNFICTSAQLVLLLHYILIRRGNYAHINMFPHLISLQLLKESFSFLL